jgi:hypothetical protein
VSLLQWCGFWTVFFVIVLGVVATFVEAPSFRRMLENIALGVGVAPFPGALMGVIVWGIVKLVS